MTREKKNEMRKKFRALRKEIEDDRRREAEEGARHSLLELTRHEPTVLSYASFKDELETTRLNSALALQGRLLLPRVEKDELVIYRVTDVEGQLAPSKLGIPEPIPSLCPAVPTEDLAVAIVPGLAFDQAGTRLGYGKGFYDRLLQKAWQATTYGIGFKEQMSSEPVPSNDNDVAVGSLLLF